MGQRTYALLPTVLLCAAMLAGCAGIVSDEVQPRTRHITMWVEAIDWEIHPGVTTPVWAFCAEGDGVEPVHGEACGVPGPTIHVNEGDTIVLAFRNDHTIPHTVHVHGWHPYAMDMHGNGALGGSMVAEAGETETIRWKAEPAGTFIYHCHFDTPTHMDMGMYGAFIVHDRSEPHPDVEYVAVLDEWRISDEPAFVGNIPAYNFFTISGKSFPLTQPIIADKGDHVRIHMVNAGYEWHAMHVHGYTPDSWEGVAGPKHAVPTDVREIAPGQSVVLDFKADREGIWLMHDHVVPRVTAGSDGSGFGAYPRGMLTALVVGQQYVDQLVGLVPTLLAAAQGDVAAPNADHAHDEAAPEAEPAPAEPAPAAAPRVTSRMEGYKFVDETLEIAAGTKVTWVNKDSAFHTVTDAAGAFDSGNINAGRSWSYTFDTPGTYKIYCKPHAAQQEGEWKGMVAQVIVS